MWGTYDDDDDDMIVNDNTKTYGCDLFSGPWKGTFFAFTFGRNSYLQGKYNSESQLYVPTLYQINGDFG